MSNQGDASAALVQSVARRCPYCGRDTTATLRAALWSGQRLAFVGPMGPVHDQLVTGLYQCDACERAIMLLFEEADEPKLIGAWPRMRAHSNDALPPEVDADRVEAWNCFFGAEHRAATVMARSAFRRALWRLDAFRGSATDELANLVTTGALPAEVARRAGDAGLVDEASPAELGPVTPDEAQRAVRTLDDFLAATMAPPVR